MSEIKDGGPAFPSHGTMGEVVCEGVSIRDYFAAKAMNSLILDGWYQEQQEESYDALADFIATDAYKLADAMLKAREVKP